LKKLAFNACQNYTDVIKQEIPLDLK